MAVVETNQMRRAHRVDIPIGIIIGSTVYKSKDWSMTGVGLENIPHDLEVGEIIDSAVRLSLTETKIEFEVKLQFKIKRDNISGFEFHNISEKQKRMLREFLELSIEGKLDSFDGILSIYNEPEINTPIKESVVFSDSEESAIKKEFVKRSNLYIKLGVLLFVLIIATIYYNTRFVYRTIGTVSGNFVKVSPSMSGRVEKIFVKVGDKVQTKTLLVKLNDKMILNQLKIIDTKLLDLSSNFINNPIPIQQNREVLNVLKRDMDKNYDAYISASNLHKKRIITSFDVQRVKIEYSKIKLKYLQEKNRLNAILTPKNNQSSIISLRLTLELKKEELMNKLNNLRVFSEANGVVYAIKSHIGNYVGLAEELIVIETDEASFVVCKIKQDEAVNLKRGVKVQVYSSFKDETYDAHVEAIGNLALNTRSMITNEVSLEEVTVKIVFDKTDVKLHLNERVKVWFYRDLF